MGEVLIVAALPDPSGPDLAHETVTVINTTAGAVDLSGWALADSAGGRQNLTGSLAPGALLQVQLDAAVRLSNRGDAIMLLDPQGRTIDQVTYKQNQVRAGRTICFGR